MANRQMIQGRSVSWLAGYLQGLLESDLTLSNLWIEGEVCNLSRSSSGHSYFTLKDEGAQIRCVMFRRAMGLMATRPSYGQTLDNGMQALAHGNVSFYEARGDVQFVVDFAQPAGLGAARAELERLKEKLGAEGLFDPARKRALPRFPRRIGVVTSASGAVFHDICHVVERRWPLVEIVLAPAPVQGTEAVWGICRAIRLLNEEGGIDVIIAGRGGGSPEELGAFNDESVARAIYGSSIPVISAVGHETDYSIADYVADVRAPTPSAAAELAVPDQGEVSRRVQSVALAMIAQGRSLLDKRQAALERSARRLRARIIDPAAERQRVRALLRQTQYTIERRLEQRSERLKGAIPHLRTLDPRRTLARGYAVVQLRENSHAVTSVRQVKGKDRLDVHVKDGRFPVDVSRQYGF